MASLWMGDIDDNMSEAFIMQAFQALGETVINVKIIRNRLTGVLSGYCFVELPDQTSAARCLQNYNGLTVPGSNPAKKFKLRHALYAKPTETSPTHPEQNQAAEYLQAFNYYSQQFQQMFNNWKYDPKTTSYSYQQYGYTPNSWQSSEDFVEEALEEPIPAMDVTEANKQFMEQSEELYVALMNCQWQPLDTVTSKIPTDE